MDQNTNQSYTNEPTNYSTNSNEIPNQNTSNNKVMGVLSYIGILALIPFLAEKNDQWVRFHAVQGMNLWIISLVISVGVSILSKILAVIPIIGAIIALVLGFVASILSLVLFIISIMGIVNVVRGEAKELPIVSKIKIIK